MRNITVVSFALLLNACGPSVIPHDGPVLIGIPVDDDQLQEVYGFMNGYGPSALGKVAIAPFTTVTEIEFVDKVFVCDPDKDAEQLCDGVTHHWSTGAHTIRVAMITDDTRQLPTEDVRCTALAHELGHVLAANVLGDSDGNHDDVRIWGSSGLIYSAIRTVCPTNTIRRYDGKSLELHVDLPIQELP